MTAQERHLLDCLNRALLAGGGTHDFAADVVPMLRDGRAQWWQRGAGCAVTELRDYPRLRELNLWLVAGALGDSLALLPEIESWAIDHGAHRIVGSGRHGWERVGRSLGFRERTVLMRKPLP